MFGNMQSKLCRIDSEYRQHEIEPQLKSNVVPRGTRNEESLLKCGFINMDWVIILRTRQEHFDPTAQGCALKYP